MNLEISKNRKIIGWVIAGLLMALFLFSASGKIMKPEDLGQLGLSDWTMIIAIGEIVSALLFLFPRTNIFGTILLSSYMGGAIIIHMTTAQSIMVPTVVLLLVWLVGFIRNPQLYLQK